MEKGGFKGPSSDPSCHVFFLGGKKMDPNGGIVVGQNPVQVV